MRPLLVKLGGSVITDKRRRFAAKLKAIQRLSRELKVTRGPPILVHGGGSFGHPMAFNFGVGAGYKRRNQLIGFSLTHRAMEKLNSLVVGALQRVGIPAVPIQTSACAVVREGRIDSMELTPVRKMLELKLVPVTYGDVVPDLSKGMSIVSGDQLAVHLALELDATRVILGVDVDGVFSGDPKKDEKAKLVRTITPANWPEIIKSLGGTTGLDVTGGMYSKIRELLSLPEHGIEAEILNASKPNILKRAVSGERGLGTRITFK